MNKKVIGVAGLAVAGVVGSGAYLVAPAFAGTSSSTPAAATSSASPNKAQHHKGAHKGKRRRIVGLHGDATIKTKKGYTQVAWERGRVTGTGSTLTVRSLDGTTWQWTLAKNTRVRKDGQKSTTTQLASNDYVVVVGTTSGSTHTAKVVVVPKKTPAGA